MRPPQKGTTMFKLLWNVAKIMLFCYALILVMLFVGVVLINISFPIN